MKFVPPSTIEKVLSIALRLAAPPALIACGAKAQPPASMPDTSAQPCSTLAQSNPNETGDVQIEQSCTEVVATAVNAKLGAGFTESDHSWYNPEQGRSVNEPAAMACCETLAADPDKTNEYRAMECCLVDVNPNMHCTPWGPPMPTAMV